LVARRRRSHPRIVRQFVGRGSRRYITRLGEGPSRRRRARHIGDRGWRPQVISIAERGVLAEGRDLERKIGPAHAWAADRPDADLAGAFLHGARTKALHLGLVPPWLALGKEITAAATRENTE